MREQFIRLSQHGANFVAHFGIIQVNVFIRAGQGLVGGHIRHERRLHSGLFGRRGSGIAGQQALLAVLGFSCRGSGRLDRGRNNGGVVDDVALHITHQGLAHFDGVLPAVSGIGGAGFENDLGHFVVCVHGGGQLTGGRMVLEGKLTVVVDLVQDQTHCIGIGSGIQRRQGIMELRGRIAAAVLGGKAGVFQGFQIHKAQITDAVFPLTDEEDIGGLQIHVHIACPAADGQGRAQIQAQVHSAQVGHSIAAQELLQRTLVGADQIDLVAQLVVIHGNDLPVLVGQEALQLGQLLQQLRFLDNTVRQFLEIFHSGCGIFVGAGQQQSVQLLLGSGDGNDLDYVFIIRIFLHGRAAAHTVVAAHGVAHDKAVQQRRNEFLF